MTKQIGLTGNMGSGKTTVAKVFEILGVPVFYADDAGHKVIANPDVTWQIEHVFGSQVIDNGGVNRKKLANIVFNSPEALIKLNALVHPAVLSLYKHFAQLNSKAPYLIFESAIIYEAQLENNFDAIIVVTAPESIKIKRIIERDNCTESAASSRLAYQIPDNIISAKSQHILCNDGNSPIIPEVIRLQAILSK